MAPIRVSRTVRFYKIVAWDRETLEEFPLGSYDWRAVIAAEAQREYCDRQYTHSGYTYVAAANPGTGNLHLALHKKRRLGEPLTVIDEATGEVREVAASTAAESYAESSMVVFGDCLPFFAVCTGGGSGAPRANRVTDWLATRVDANGSRLSFDVVPLASAPDLTALTGADGARSVHLKVPMQSMQRSSETDSGLLAPLLRRIQGTMDEGYVELKVSTGARLPSTKDRQAMLDFATSIATELGGEASGQVSVVRDVPGAKPNTTKLESELVELVESRLAEPVEILVGSEQAMMDATFQQIDAAVLARMGAIRRVLGAVDARQSGS